MTRAKAILSAAGITSIVLITILAISVINLISNGTITINMPGAVDNKAQLEDLGARQAALDQAAAVMGDRQTDYTVEIATAQRRIADLQVAINAQRAQNTGDAQTIADLEGQMNVANATLGQVEGQAALWQQKEEGYSAEITSLNEQILALQSQIDQLAGQ
jgi:predicted  nucleic acid-binding Zn-ribbon protein